MDQWVLTHCWLLDFCLILWVNSRLGNLANIVRGSDLVQNASSRVQLRSSTHWGVLGWQLTIRRMVRVSEEEPRVWIFSFLQCTKDIICRFLGASGQLFSWIRVVGMNRLELSLHKRWSYHMVRHSSWSMVWRNVKQPFPFNWLQSLIWQLPF